MRRRQGRQPGLDQLAATLLPTNKLNQCAFRLNGASLDPNRPARICVGEGVAGGTIPGAEISFSGILGVGVMPDTTFPYYPFIGFSSIETNLANVAGTYTLPDPFNASQASLATALNLEFTQTVPGVETTTPAGAATGTTPTGKMIFTGGVLGYLDLTNAASPYFTIGAFVQ